MRRVVELPIFPLSSVVLFPGVRAPLHIFEPRYRDLTTAALAGDRRIGMVAVRPEHAAHLDGDPSVFSVGCVGEIVEHERLEDGRYNIVLLGTERFRIEAEPPRPPGRRYRVARVELIEETVAASQRSRVQGLRVRVSQLFGDLVRALAPTRADEISPALLGAGDDASFVNTLCQLLTLPPVEKQGLLEADGIAARYEALAAALHFRLAAVAARSEGDPTVH